MTYPPSPPNIAEKPATFRVENALSYILRVGVTLSIALVLFGTVLTFIHHEPDYFTHARHLEDLSSLSEPFPHTLGEMCERIGHFRGQGFVILGLMVLLLTPIVSVATAIFAFAFQKNRTFAIISALVLAILILSLILGKAEGA
ncbi:MAG: DUF1634 domain-containing protein [Phycisphaerales bacterium]|nr:DUF1634 domain-containing protein [Phycisphaerales bacterium]